MIRNKSPQKCGGDVRILFHEVVLGRHNALSSGKVKSRIEDVEKRAMAWYDNNGQDFEAVPGQGQSE